MQSDHQFVGQVPRITSALGRSHAASPRASSTSPISSLQILEQVVVAFQKRPDVANVLHGQRRIRQGGRGRRTALFSSIKSGGAVPVESKLELAHAVALERTSHVTRFRTQALCIPLTGRHVAYPDFLVEVASGMFEVHEIKPSIAHLSSDDAQRFAHIERILNRVGIEFRLIDATSLASGRALEETLLSYTRGHAERYSPSQISLAQEVLASKSFAWFSDAYKLLASHHLPPCLADYLAFHGKWSSPPRTNASRRGRA